MRMHILLAAFATVGAVACASQEGRAEPVPVEYKVIRADVTIPFSRDVRHFRVGADNSLLLEVGGNRWYRAQLPEPCKSDLDWEMSIGLADRAATSISKFTDVIVDSRRCRIIGLDQIEDPKAAEAAARAAAATKTAS